MAEILSKSDRAKALAKLNNWRESTENCRTTLPETLIRMLIIGAGTVVFVVGLVVANGNP